ncbi:MAG: hypothetical protein Tsb0018_11750 [Opitutales bacterium]|tara:strand:+ start:679 stop:1407 length:729 start_codon:yes stop_codon:yes gene_type:complete
MFLMALTLFITMFVFIQREEKYQEIIHQITDQGLAGRILDDPFALGADQETTVSVLFCDIRGFTAIMNELGIQDSIDFINEHMTALSKAVYDHGGVIDKFNGDRLMVVFGHEANACQSVQRAAQCALDMVEIRRHLNMLSGMPVRIGLGLATGPAIAGYVGAPNRKNYTVLGNCVNVAAILCDISTSEQILIDRQTAAILGDTINFESLTPFTIDGIDDPIEVLQLQSFTGECPHEFDSDEA